MKIKAYAVCNRTRKGDLYITKKTYCDNYAIFEKKKDALKYLEGVGEYIETITLEIGE